MKWLRVLFGWKQRTAAVNVDHGVGAGRDIRDTTIKIGLDEKDVGRRIDEAQRPVNEQLTALTADFAELSPKIELLVKHRAAISNSDRTRQVLFPIFGQYDRLKAAIDIHEKIVGREQQQDKLAAAEHIISELRTVLGNVRKIDTLQGQVLFIKIGHNTFRITFPIPARIVPPTIEFRDLPPDVTPNVIEKSRLGFTVVFSPSTIPVEEFGFLFCAEINGPAI